MAEFRVDDRGEPSSIPGWFERWAPVANESDLTFFLPEEDLHSSAIVLLGAMAASRLERGVQNRVGGYAPADLAGVFAVASTSGKLGYEIPNGLGLHPIESLNAARAIADRVSGGIAQHAPALSPSVVHKVRFVFEELGANVVQHSGRPDTGFGYMRVDVEAGRFELAFADAGVGFRASLQRNPELECRVSDDAHALRLALTRSVSGATDAHTNMGFGLHYCAMTSDELGGDLWIASGSALLQRRTIDGLRTNTIRRIPPWQGAWICLDAPIA